MTPPPAPVKRVASDQTDAPVAGKSRRLPKARTSDRQRALGHAVNDQSLPTEKEIAEILHFKVSTNEVAYKRITQNLRELILSKALPPGSRLLTLTRLAELWKTNYFTVQTALTPLVNEGLLVRKQRTGTFVAENTRQIKAVGIYFGASLWRVKHAAFYQALYTAFCDHCERKGVTVHLFMDSRPRGAQQATPWPPLTEAINRSEVNAVIGAMLSSEQAIWLERLPLPVSLLGAFEREEAKFYVDLGMHDFLRSSLLRLKARNCRSVALISASRLPGTDSVRELAAKLGLECRPEWVFRQGTWPEEYEEFGFESFSKIWSGPVKPDGLIVYPDNIALGVIMGVLQQGIRVPDELKLVMHCNEEVYFHCPIPADWQVVSVVKIIDILWKHLLLKADGQKPRKITSRPSLRPVSPLSPPTLRKWKPEHIASAHHDQ